MSLSATALVDLTQTKMYLRVSTASYLQVYAEYAGMGDGITKVFALDYAPVEGSLRLYVDGVLQAELTHFTISGSTITFVTAPANGKPITADYDRVSPDNTFESYDDDILEKLIEAATEEAEKYTGRAFVQREITESHLGDGSSILRLYKRPVVSITSVSWKRTERYVGDGSTKIFTLGNTPKAGSLEVYVDGVLKTIDVDYTLSGRTITFTSAPTDGAVIVCKYGVALGLSADYTEQLHIGRLKGSWWNGYEYVVIYKTGYGTTREAVQPLVPDAVAAVLEVMAFLYENRTDRVDSTSVSGLGSVSYKLPSRARELLNPYRTNMLG